jgi:hypothetical protein
MNQNDEDRNKEQKPEPIQVLDDEYIEKLLESTRKRSIKPRRSCRKLTKMISYDSVLSLEIAVVRNKAIHELLLDGVIKI